MSNNHNDLLFWLDQEPVDGSEDNYLPADTPLNNLPSKILYQKHLKQQKREKRTLGRVSDYYYYKLKELRKNTATEFRSKFEQEDSLAQYIFIKDSSEFLKESSEELSDLMNYMSKVKSGEITTFEESMDTDLPEKSNTQVVKENKTEIENFYNTGYKKIMEEYTKIVQELNANASHNSSSSRMVSPTTIPSSQSSDRTLPRDPRLR